jgi:hypothetical protein
LQCDIDTIQTRYLLNCMKPNASKAKDISSERKTNRIDVIYKSHNKSVERCLCVKHLGVFLGCKLYFHSQADYIFIRFTSVRYDSRLLLP